ncbi:Uncharacterised protein [Achromobacter sp. 2789STDY5608615]|nr:Uncharacterised protein [Achromobacter sp. 2789STDY5608615]
MMVLPAPMTLTASALACVPRAWTLPPWAMVSVPLEPNSTVLLPALHKPAPDVARLEMTAPAATVMAALSPRLTALALLTSSLALGCIVTDAPAAVDGPCPIGAVAGLGAAVLQVVAEPVVTQAAWTPVPGQPPNNAAPTRTVRRRGTSVNDFAACIAFSSRRANNDLAYQSLMPELARRLWRLFFRFPALGFFFGYSK